MRPDTAGGNQNRIPIRKILEYFGFTDLGAEGSKILCKFHQEDHPSAVFYQYYFKCFACGVQGDGVRLLHDREGLSWREAYDRAASITGEVRSEVREGRRSGSGLPGRSRPVRRNRPFVPPGSSR